MLPCVHNAEEGKSNAAAAAASARLAAGAQSAGHGQERTGRFQPRLQDGVPLAIRTLLRLDLLGADRAVVDAVCGRAGPRQRRHDGEVGGGEAEVPRQDQPRQEGTSRQVTLPIQGDT